MKRLAIAIALSALFSAPGHAGINCTLPFNLQNGTTADATQVMANYNQLVTCLESAAADGANNDITALNALATPVTLAQGGTPVYVGGTSTGSGNAQVVATVAPTGFSLTAGRQVTFIAGFSNTGAATLNVTSSGAKNIFRRTQLGISAAVGGEIVAGHQVTVIYDGTQFQIISIPPAQVGEGKDWFTGTPPAGWKLRDGSSLLRADFPDLFTVIGTTYGAADATHFSLPDERGRMSFAQDGASRLTSACAGSNTLGTVCGDANGLLAIAQNQLPNVSPTVTINQVSLGTISANQGFAQRSGNFNVASGSPLSSVNDSDATPTVTIPPFTPTGTVSSINGGVAQQQLPILNGSLVVNKIIKF